MPTVYLGLGSNIGNRKENILHAIDCLIEKKIEVARQSAIIETDPAGGPPQIKFLNAVIECKTDIFPHKLLNTVKNIEKQLGRKETVRNGPRIIDIDILLYGKEIIETPRLTIPHPRMFERDFVIRPLEEIAPKLFQEMQANIRPTCPSR